VVFVEGVVFEISQSYAENFSGAIEFPSATGNLHRPKHYRRGPNRVFYSIPLAVKTVSKDGINRESWSPALVEAEGAAKAAVVGITAVPVVERAAVVRAVAVVGAISVIVGAVAVVVGAVVVSIVAQAGEGP
jgi:hypothetical protein